MPASHPPAAPPLDVRVVSEEEKPDATSGFVRLRRVQVAVFDAENKASAPFVYDVAERKQMDAAVMLVHCEKDGVRQVYLRSALRVPLAIRKDVHLDGTLWELPAGLVEVGEAADVTAVREIAEELGFHVNRADLKPLGPPTVPVPGLIAERQFFFSIEVDPATREKPEEDGALEQGAAIELVPLDTALAWCRAGHIPDAKTELALRRFAERETA